MLTRILDWFKNLYSSILFKLYKGHRGVRPGDYVLVYWDRTPYVSISDGQISTNKVIAVREHTGYKTYIVKVYPEGTLEMHEAWVE